MKAKKSDYICIATALLFVVVGLLLPKSGPWALMDEVFDILVLVAMVMYLAMKAGKVRGGFREKWYVYLLCFGLALFCAWGVKNVVLDVVNGPQVIELQNIQVSKRQGVKGLSSLHYYMSGEDAEGKDYKVEISGQEYSSMSTRNTAIITYYKNTKRFYGLGDRT